MTLHGYALIALLLLLMSCGGPSGTSAQATAHEPVSSKKAEIEFDDSIDDSESAESKAASPDPFRARGNLDSTTQNIEKKTVASEQPSLPLEIRVQRGHTANITAHSFSKDGRLVATGTNSGSVKLWNVQNSILLRNFEIQGSVHSISFSHDSSRLLAKSRRGGVTVWEVESGAKVSALKTKEGSFDSMGMYVFSDGKRILTDESVSRRNGKRYRIVVLNLLSGRVERSMEAVCDAYGSFMRFSVSPDEARAITTCADGQYILWDLKSGSRLETYNSSIEGRYHQSHILPDNKHAVLMHPKDNRTVFEIWNFEKNKITKRQIFKKKATSFSLSNDGSLVAIHTDGIFKANVVLMDLPRWKQTAIFKKDVCAVGNVSFTPNGTKVVAPPLTEYPTYLNIWDVRLKKITGQISNMVSGSIIQLDTPSEGPLLAASSGDGNVYIWDTQNGFQTLFLDADMEGIISLDYSPNGRYIMTSEMTVVSTGKPYTYFGVRLWDALTGAMLRFKKERKRVNEEIAFSWDNSKALVGGFESYIVRDTQSWKTLFTIPFDKVGSASAAFSKDGKTALVLGHGSESGFYDMKKRKRIVEIDGRKVRVLAIHPDGVHAIRKVSSRKRRSGESFEMWNLKTNSKIRAFSRPPDIDKKASSRNSVFSRDGTRIASIWDRSKLYIWNVQNAELIGSLDTKKSDIETFTLLPNKKYVATGHRDGAIRIWNLENKKHFVMLSRGREWIVFTEDGYFDASRQGGELVSMIRGLESYHIDQLAARYNRPDIILKRMELGTPRLIEHYRTMHARRLKRLGISEISIETAFENAPTACILESKTVDKSAHVKLLFEDSSSGLARYNVYVNDVPIHGTQGRSISGKTKTIEEKIELTSGKNKIEVGATNKRGVESLRPTVTINYSRKNLGDLYYLGFGISKYANPDLNLKYGAKDAEDLGDLFKSDRAHFNEVHTKVYKNEEVTVENIGRAKKFLANATVDDTFVLFVAGHGLYTDGKGASYHYLTHETDIRNVSETSVPFRMIEELLQDIKPRKKLFLMDTCQSGELYDSTNSKMPARARRSGLVSRGIRKKVMDDANIRQPEAILKSKERYIYNDLLRRTGAIVLSSSRGNEYSYESDKIENGYFTEQIIDALSTKSADKNKDKRITTNELRKYVIDTVSRKTSGMQNPVVDRDNLELNFSFPIMK
ncbi:MAG: hypothetical protein GY847_25770 [Proteobacteria bacterium]|nr:hypothetical protein [Pseudomonadota bacterium]